MTVFTTGTPGICDMSLEEYLADPCPEPSLSSHIARELLDASPLHAWTKHQRLNRDARPDPTPAKELGTLAHRLVLEGRCASDVVVIDAKDYRTKAAQAQRDEARAANKIPMLEAHWNELDAMLAAWLGHFRQLDPVPFVGGVPEQTLIWQDQGTWCRARLDYVTPTEITELKTTSTTAHPAEWARRKLWEGGLELQAAFHQRGLAVLTGEQRDFRFIVAETEPPYAVSAVSLDPEAFDYAHARRREAVTLWRDCLTRGVWPGYPTRCAFAELPPWIKARAMEGAYWR